MDVRTLEAGRDLDTLIAESIFDWKYVGNGHWFDPRGTQRAVYEIATYSTDPESAWPLIDKIHAANPVAHGVFIQRVLLERETNEFEWSVGYVVVGDEGQEEHRWLASGETAPLALCRAALVARKVKGEKK